MCVWVRDKIAVDAASNAMYARNARQDADNDEQDGESSSLQVRSATRNPSRGAAVYVYVSVSSPQQAERGRGEYAVRGYLLRVGGRVGRRREGGWKGGLHSRWIGGTYQTHVHVPNEVSITRNTRPRC